SRFAANRTCVVMLPGGNRNRARTLRELLSGSEIIQAPGAYDCLSARLIESAGFPVVYMTGFGTSAAYLGRPDVGLLGMSEMVDNAKRIVDAVAIPVIADADTAMEMRSTSFAPCKVTSE